MQNFNVYFYRSYYPDLQKNGIITQRQALRHWQQFGEKEGRLGSLQSGAYHKQLALLNAAKDSLKNTNKTDNNNNQKINILTRTHNRPDKFKQLRESIIQQIHTNIRHLVSVQNREDYDYVLKSGVPHSDILLVKKQSKSSHFYNIFINDLLKLVTDGWVMFLDDDDCFVSPNSLQFINQYFNDTSKLVVWQAWFPDKIIPSAQNPYFISEGDITSCCFAFHISSLQGILWDDKRAADYRFFRQLLKNLEPHFVPQIITEVLSVGDGTSSVNIGQLLFYYFRSKWKGIQSILNNYFAQVPNWFDWKLYASYPDLQKNGITTKVRSWNHWKKFGVKENRVFQKNAFNSLLESKRTQKYKADSKTVIYLIDKGLEDGASGYAVKSHHSIQLLQKLDFNVIPVIKPKGNSDFCNYIHEGIRYRQLTNDSSLIPNSQQYLENYANQLLLICHELKPSILHTCSDYRNGLVAAQVAKKLGIKFIYEVRGLWEVTASAIDNSYEKTPLYQIAKQGEIAACEQADTVLAINSGLAKELVSRGIDENKIKVIPFEVFGQQTTSNAPIIEKTKFSINTNDIVIGYFGNFSTLEGIPDFVTVLIKLYQEGITNFKCILIGSGADFNKVATCINVASMQNSIHLLPKVPYSEIGSYYSLIDLFCIPRRDSAVANMVLPMKLIEAMALKKPLLVSSVDAMADVVKDQINGFVFKKDDYDDLYLKLKQIIKDKSILQKLKFEQNNENEYYSFITNIYNSLL